VNWPHRPEDITLLLELGDGFIASDEIGRPLGAGMVFSYAPDVAMIGMMMTHPKLQAGGLGAHILDELPKLVDTDVFRLNATRSAHRLYRSAGFLEAGAVTQYQGMVGAVPKVPDMALRPANDADFETVVALDRAAHGVSREGVLRALWPMSSTTLLSDGSRVTGFAMCRLFGRGRLIGPLIAPDESAAIALAQAFLLGKKNLFFRLDAETRFGVLGQFLNAAGLESYDRVIPMTRGGADRIPPDGVFALASQALG
jgi:hypothetical protein